MELDLQSELEKGLLELLLVVFKRSTLAQTQTVHFQISPAAEISKLTIS